MLVVRDTQSIESREVASSPASGNPAASDVEKPADSDQLESANMDSIQPCFPAGLAKSQEQTTRFNLNLFMLDTLTLPQGLFAEEVQFVNAEECMQYYKRYVDQHLQQL